MQAKKKIALGTMIVYKNVIGLVRKYSSREGGGEGGTVEGLLRREK